MKLPDGKFAVIVADPPWNWRAWSSRGEGRSASRHYDVMSLDDIMAMPVEDIAADDCALFLWATSPMLPQAIEVMDAWGFTYKTVAFMWIKVALSGRPMTGMGYWTQQNAEFVLLGTRGRPRRKSASVHSVVMERRGRHSEKPEAVQERIEELLDGPYCELFARRRRDGWTCWGNELEEEI